MEIEILQILYVCLIIFTIVIGVLLSIALVKVIRLLDVVDDMAKNYMKVKETVSYYTNVSNLKNMAYSLFKK